MKSIAITPTLQRMFAEVMQQCEAAPPAGSVYERLKETDHYLYAKVPVGTGRIDVFLGRRGDAEAEAKAEDLRQGMSLAKDRRTLVALLKRAGLAGPDRSMGAALDAIAYAGLFRDGAVLVGSAAYMMFGPHVGRRLPAPSLMTGDLDLATATLALSADPPVKMEAILKWADPTYAGVMPADPRQPPTRFRNAKGYLVDLITPTRHRDVNPMPLEASGAGAAAFKRLAWLIESPIKTVALWGAGIAVTIPQPARFAVHKLILAQRRDSTARIKRRKDLSEAQALMHALSHHDPLALDDALDAAQSLGKAGWSDPIARSLKELQSLPWSSPARYRPDAGGG